MNRKEFIRTFGRSFILAAMGVFIVGLARRDRITRYSECTGNLKCKECASLKRCALPEAQKMKADGKE